MSDEVDTVKSATASHTMIIVVGALALLWLLGSTVFKGVRQ